MAQFDLTTKTFETTEAQVQVIPSLPLELGEHRFQLVVIDDAGIESLPSEVKVQVLERPTAVLKATPEKVTSDGEFTLSGHGSEAPEGRRIAKYHWTYLGQTTTPITDESDVPSPVRR